MEINTYIFNGFILYEKPRRPLAGLRQVFPSLVIYCKSYEGLDVN